MRGQAFTGFRITKQRLKKGLTTRPLLEAHHKIEQRAKQGKPLAPSLIAAQKQIEKNKRLIAKKKLLSPEIDGKHAVVKSAIRRHALEQSRKTG